MRHLRVFMSLLVALLSADLRAEDATPTLAQTVRITCIDGQLRFNWADELLRDSVPLTVNSPNGRWRVSAVTGTGIGVDRLVEQAHSGAGFWNISITSTAGSLRLSAMRGGNTPGDTRLTLSQREGAGVRVMVSAGLTGKVVNLRAQDLLELRLRHPQVVRDYIEPILSQLGAGDLLTPGATDVYRVFDELTADSKTSDAVLSILPKLSAAAYAERERANSELRRLGHRAVLALVRMETSNLPPESQARIAQLLAEQTRRTIDDPQRARSDPEFLADCLDFRDEQVQAAATARIEKLTGWKVPPADWAHPADYIRGMIAKQASRP
jgi:hypothetical protein